MSKESDLNQKIVFKQVEFGEFTFMLSNQGSSDEVGSIESQYLEDLKSNNHTQVHTLGLYACDRLISSLSYGIIELKRESGVATRLDVIVTVKDCRGLGVSELLIAKCFDLLLANYDDMLKMISTIAVHPATAHILTGYGFRPPPANSSTPLYTLDLTSEESRFDFRKKTDLALSKYLTHLKYKCLDCQHRPWVSPWCKAS